VQSAFDGKKIALVEAQTGTGKTLAYLIPALQRTIGL
jgi:Rad3-related DNA helicase